MKTPFSSLATGARTATGQGRLGSARRFAVALSATVMSSLCAAADPGWSYTNWADSIRWGYDSTVSQAGYQANVGGSPVTFGTPEGQELSAADYGLGGGQNADQPWQVSASSSTSIGTHHAYVHGQQMQVQVLSQWSDEVVFTGPAGVGYTSLGTFLDFSYALPTYPYSGYLEGVLKLDIGQGFTHLASIEIAVSFESVYGDCFRHDAEAWYQPVSCASSIAMGASRSFTFEANVPIQISSSLYVSAVGYSDDGATLDARNTAGIAFFDLPEGYGFSYTSGRTDNPLGIAPAASVPEPSVSALLLLGLVAVRMRRGG